MAEEKKIWVYGNIQLPVAKKKKPKVFTVLRRILFAIVYAATIPLVLAGAMSIVVVGPICVLIWIFNGDDDDVLMYLVTAPMCVAVNLPYVIMGDEMSFKEMCGIE